MSLTFISNIIENLDQENINKHCSTIWNAKKDSALKLFFFIRDKDKGKNQPKEFTKIMSWLFINHEDIFYKNFSLIVGVPNTHTLDLVQSQKMLEKDWKKHEEILSFFIEEDHKESFRKNWNITTKNKLLETYKLPEYGTWEDIIEITEYIKKIQKKDNKKLFYTVVNLFSNAIKKDIKEKKHSKAWETLIKYPQYENFIKENLITQSYDSLKEENMSLTTTESKKGTHLDFIERYAFVNV